MSSLDPWTIIENAKNIFQNWLEAGTLTNEDVVRVLSGDYLHYVTFKILPLGTQKNSYAAIHGAKTLTEAKKVAEEHWPGKVKDVYEEREFKFALYEGGLAFVLKDNVEVRPKKKKQRT
jgi:hypothetical protein